MQIHNTEYKTKIKFKCGSLAVTPYHTKDTYLEVKS